MEEISGGETRERGGQRSSRKTSGGQRKEDTDLEAGCGSQMRGLDGYRRR